MAEVEIYTAGFLLLLGCGQGAPDAQGRGVHGNQCDGINRDCAPQMIERANGGSTFPQIFIGSDACRRLRRSLRARGSRQARSAAWRPRHPGAIGEREAFRMTTGKAAPTSRPPDPDALRAQPDANLDGAIEADRRGQDRRRRLRADARDDQHPGRSREQLFATIVRRRTTRRSRPSASSRARSASISMSARSAIKLSAEKAANRSFLIDRDGEIVARYDKIHMFDVDLSKAARAIASRAATGRAISRSSPTCRGAGSG